MIKSTRVNLGLVAFVASTLAACGPRDVRRCVDQNDWVVDDERCAQAPRPGFVPMYHWYYGGRGFNVGERALGGSLAPKPGVSYRSNVSRGGFGRLGSFHASGGSHVGS